MPDFPVLHCPLSWWCHSTISSSVAPFSSCPPSFPASGSFPMSQLFASGGRSIGASASAAVLPMNIQGCFPLGLTDLIFLLSKGLSWVFSNTTVGKHQFFSTLSAPMFLVAQSCPTLCNPMDCSPPSSSVHGDSPGKNTGVGYRALLQGIFPTQGSNPGLLHCRWILYHLSHEGSSWILEWVAYSFSRGSSQPGNQTGVSCIADGFFTSWATCYFISYRKLRTDFYWSKRENEYHSDM